MPSPGDQGAVALLSRLVGTGGIGITVSLFRNNVTPTPQSQPGDFLPANFTGYEVLASKKWAGPADDGDGVAVMTSPPFTWVKTADGAPSPVYGFKLGVGGTEQAPAPQVLCARKFSTPIALTKRGASIEAVFVLTAVASPDGVGTPLIVSCDVRLRVDQTRFRGQRRGIVQGMIRRINQLVSADGRASEQAEMTGKYANLFFLGDNESAAAATVIQRAGEILVR